MNFLEEAISFVFPRRCPVCDEIIQADTYICRECRGKLQYVQEPVCKKCGKPLEDERREYCGDCTGKRHFFIQGKAVFEYREGMKVSMYRFKYSNKREYADFYAGEAARIYGDWIRRHRIEAIVPIPMYLWKKRRRGYNQAEVFAVRLGKKLRIPVEQGLVKRIRNTTPQKELNDIQRKENLKKAFKIVPNIVKYKKILLVDDIYTTGSTMDAVTQVLLEAGVKEVYFICICIGNGF